ncbi:MAG TPA: peptidylprolyl isomerase [Anaerolineaceae bacterium]|jgi:cyclophilin family peptidyl-prolyl cis-trans isomerase/protein-disulfide isomerase
MRKFLPMVLLCAVLAAAAAGCSGSPAETPTLTPAPTATAAGVTAASCMVDSQVAATPNPTDASLFPPPDPTDWSVGPATASTIFIEYGDFMCPSCARLSPVLAQIQKNYPNDVRIVFRHFPLPQHDKAPLAAQAAEAAGLQGKFWELHDLFYAHQADWVTMTSAQFEEWLKNQATRLGLDVAKFETDLHSEATVQKVKQAAEQGLKMGLPGTPYLVINGKAYGYSSPKEKENLEPIVLLYRLTSRQFTTCPPMEIDVHKQYTATLKTAKGDIVIQLYAGQAPTTVNNFVFLAKKGWYDGVTFHSVIPGSIAQTGDPSGTGYGSPGYFFGNEIDPTVKFDGPGMVGMANAGPGSNGSQFFITSSAMPSLDGQYTIFGKVIQGMDVVQKLTPRDPTRSNNLPPGDQISAVTIEEK